ncbi:low molecular weight phosphotyrosine protein phosphatase [Niveibacterium sp. 24ML]|uniref:low molecular weight protein-tyrosine-phosphatase n=1 Tax=Niveibacterium sp. 24ML TaxID=2985512 RepID=UPI00226E0C94|nr:low molecular weight protein-tyrosine-phosphatase [Niveibacterium sp. 24ML]MCX9158260.1 low molecular weight phosphotyrosine protein phosphatase [Niveibacterium sp. 24ML]
MKRVLFVCTGNICRSPTAEGVARVFFNQAGLDVDVDSAGIQGIHAGEAPDQRSQKAAMRRGFDLSKQRARKIAAADFTQFDLIFAMDRGHLTQMKRICPPELQGKLKLFRDLLPGQEGLDVPDPYYGGEAGFEHVLDLCEDGVGALMAALRANAL